MTDTAAQVSSMKPSQIHGFIVALGVDPAVLGVKTPGTNAGVKDGTSEADRFIETATREAKEKGLNFSSLLSDKDGFSLSEYDNLEGQEYSRAVGGAIISEYLRRGSSPEEVNDFIDGVDMDKVGTWEALSSQAELDTNFNGEQFSNPHVASADAIAKKNFEEISQGGGCEGDPFSQDFARDEAVEYSNVEKSALLAAGVEVGYGTAENSFVYTMVSNSYQKNQVIDLGGGAYAVQTEMGGFGPVGQNVWVVRNSGEEPGIKNFYLT